MTLFSKFHNANIQKIHDKGTTSSTGQAPWFCVRIIKQISEEARELAEGKIPSMDIGERSALSLNERKQTNAQRIALKRLYKTINFYDPISIDSFLWHHANDKDMVDRAKYCIASIIINSIKEDLFEYSARARGFYVNWYRFLWDAIVSGKTAEEISDPKTPFLFNIITFNYDTSLERFLYTRITDDNSMFTEEQQKSLLEKLKECIHHVYGCVPHYEWMGGDTSDWETNEQPTLLTVKNYQNIQLIGERNESDYKELQGYIENAAQVIFLGFGFDDTNIGNKVLDLKNTLKEREFITCPHSAKKWPRIKYTNKDNSEIINRKIYSVMTDTDNGNRYELLKNIGQEFLQMRLHF